MSSQVKLNEVDEVWLGMDQAYAAFIRDGHHPDESPFNCQSCHALFLLKRGMERYRERSLPKAPV